MPRKRERLEQRRVKNATECEQSDASCRVALPCRLPRRVNSEQATMTPILPAPFFASHSIQLQGDPDSRRDAGSWIMPCAEYSSDARVRGATESGGSGPQQRALVSWEAPASSSSQQHLRIKRDERAISASQCCSLEWESSKVDRIQASCKSVRSHRRCVGRGFGRGALSAVLYRRSTSFECEKTVSQNHFEGHSNAAQDEVDEQQR